MTAVKTIRRCFTVGKHRAVLSVQLAAGVPAGVSVEWDRDKPPRLSVATCNRKRLNLQSSPFSDRNYLQLKGVQTGIICN